MEAGRQKVPAELMPDWYETVEITLVEVYGAENLHHLAQLPFLPLIAQLYSKLPQGFRRHIHRVIESSYQLWKSRS
ncbi:hypothetical protein [Microbulbifer variabilis]|uniref:hypothetical protein n=1 Tax=Microbulbifer variabilis TaxID=266805 RepID=UPI001CFCEAFD|nr:hypothetical protein [Microbulbifer variabilis]